MRVYLDTSDFARPAVSASRPQSARSSARADMHHRQPASNAATAAASATAPPRLLCKGLSARLAPPAERFADAGPELRTAAADPPSLSARGYRLDCSNSNNNNNSVAKSRTSAAAGNGGGDDDGDALPASAAIITMRGTNVRRKKPNVPGPATAAAAAANATQQKPATMTTSSSSTTKATTTRTYAFVNIEDGCAANEAAWFSHYVREPSAVSARGGSFKTQCVFGPRVPLAEASKQQTARRRGAGANPPDMTPGAPVATSHASPPSRVIASQKPPLLGATSVDQPHATTGAAAAAAAARSPSPFFQQRSLSPVGATMTQRAGESSSDAVASPPTTTTTTFVIRRDDDDVGSEGATAVSALHERSAADGGNCETTIRLTSGVATATTAASLARVGARPMTAGAANCAVRAVHLDRRRRDAAAATADNNNINSNSRDQQRTIDPRLKRSRDLLTEALRAGEAAAPNAHLTQPPGRLLIAAAGGPLTWSGDQPQPHQQQQQHAVAFSLHSPRGPLRSVNWRPGNSCMAAYDSAGGVVLAGAIAVMGRSAVGGGGATAAGASSSSQAQTQAQSGGVVGGARPATASTPRRRHWSMPRSPQKFDGDANAGAADAHDDSQQHNINADDVDCNGRRQGADANAAAATAVESPGGGCDDTPAASASQEQQQRPHQRQQQHQHQHHGGRQVLASAYVTMVPGVFGAGLVSTRDPRVAEQCLRETSACRPLDLFAGKNRVPVPCEFSAIAY